MSLPAVTVLITNYNYGKYISKAIRSALLQDYKGVVNIVVVDDCSTDSSVKSAQETLCLSNPPEPWTKNGDISYTSLVTDNDGVHMIVKLNKNSGPSTGRNIGIEVSKDFTDVYAVLDADDMMMSNKISACVTVMQATPQIGVVYADYNIVNVNTGNVVREYKEPFSFKRLSEECIVHSGSLITKQALLECADQFGYYDSQMRTCEDYDLWLRVAEKFMIVHIAEPLTLVRATDMCSSATVPTEIWQQNWARVQQKAQNRNG
jgi:glycosyltransferase involved in cell wall biosynthesis